MLAADEHSGTHCILFLRTCVPFCVPAYLPWHGMAWRGVMISLPLIQFTISFLGTPKTHQNSVIRFAPHPFLWTQETEVFCSGLILI